jgi:membrane fusion protein, multidrug efflux system
MLLLVTLAILVIAIGYGIYWETVLRLRETTDDAYVNGNVVQITPQIAGTVVGINADDTQYVTTGQALVRLDPADAKVALDQAEANLALTVRSVRGLFATTAQLNAAQGIRQADLDTAEKDLARRERLAGSGAISGEELQHAREAVSAARSALLASQQ